MKSPNAFTEEYKKLNSAQKEAVDAIDGPVMVVAGPGTGKTQILALRIANILKKTDVGSSSILCLTFTNSAVSAMQERLRKYIGGEASRVDVLTFHRFAGRIIEEFYHTLGFDAAPRVLEDAEAVSLADSILREHEWQYLKPRGNIGRYFKELKSLVSFLKRERISHTQFLYEIKTEIDSIQNNPLNISSRGESKGKLKKEFMDRIESFERTKETARFYELYEARKREANLMDHDDTIAYALKILEDSELARAEIRERYLYVLVDEHQDSSGSQNSILKAVWQKEEKPNIFVVGDDRQLIYAFGGARLSHFKEFETMFGKARIIFLTDNYRSTEKILAAADALLSSSFSKEKLITKTKQNYDLRLIECDYPRDEIIACGLDLQRKLADKKLKLDSDDCAILVPKNRQLVSAIRVLEDMGLPVARADALPLFITPEFKTVFKVLKIYADVHDEASFAELLLDPVIDIPIFAAHAYLFEHRGKHISLAREISNKISKQEKLFLESDPISLLIQKLKNLIEQSGTSDLYTILQTIGEEFLLTKAGSHDELVRRTEVIRTLLHLALSFEEQGESSVREFVAFLERLEEYEEDIPLAALESEKGIKVLTLHGSKGLEFDYVWIAHLDEKSLMKGKRRNFVLPESIVSRIEEKDELAAKRELYVAITRAKRFSTLSHSRFSYTGSTQELAKVISDLPNTLFTKVSARESEQHILAESPKTYVLKEAHSGNPEPQSLPRMLEMVKREYRDVPISVSLLNNFFECPWKWYFLNLLRLPEKEKESLKFGNAVHAAIEKVLKLKHPPTHEELREIVGSDQEVRHVVTKWLQHFSALMPHRENERSLSVKATEFPHLSLYGRLDLIEFIDDKTIRITDFKTGSVRKKSEIEKRDEESRMSNYLRQLAMYSFLIDRSPKWKVKISGSRLEFLEAKDDKERLYERVIGTEELDSLVADIRDYDELVASGKWATRTCRFNSYGKNTECAYCQMAKIYTKE